MANGPAKKKRLGDLLVQEGVITAKQLERAVEVQRTKGGRLGDILVELNLATEELVLSVLAKRAGVPFVSSLTAYGKIAPEVLALLSSEVAQTHNVFPLAKEGNTLTVALADPFVDLNVVDDLKIQTGCDIKVVLASEKEIQKAVALHGATMGKPSGEPGAPSTHSDAQMETIVSALLETAAKVGADHIYLEPGARAVRVRYRIHGSLQQRPDLPPRHLAPLIAHLKSMAGLNIAERWLPQDGHFRRSWEGHDLEIRVATLPTASGEKAVLSLLDSDRALPLDLARLGLDPDMLAQYQSLAQAKNGLVIVAGPAGSGKTATLYATLAALNTPERHVVTIEDPVERTLEGISQMQVRADVRMSLASGLHVLRRQDPDVIMVGEIRDLETAEAVLDAASEALVVTAVIATDTLGAIQKLIEMGVPPTLLAARLSGVLAQRLVRSICPNCRETYSMSLRELMASGVGDKEIRAAKRAESFTLQRGRGCGQCLGTGYAGAAPVFELCAVSEGLRRLIAEKAGPSLLARETAERVTLREAAVKRVLAGQTTVEEALRV
jgi:type IV pilus assembly protein PilB